MPRIMAGRLPAFYPWNLFEGGFNSAPKITDAFAVNDADAGNAFFTAGREIVYYHIRDFDRAKCVQVENPVNRYLDSIFVLTHLSAFTCLR